MKLYTPPTLPDSDLIAFYTHRYTGVRPLYWKLSASRVRTAAQQIHDAERRAASVLRQQWRVARFKCPAKQGVVPQASTAPYIVFLRERLGDWQPRSSGCGCTPFRRFGSDDAPPTIPFGIPAAPLLPRSGGGQHGACPETASCEAER